MNHKEKQTTGDRGQGEGVERKMASLDKGPCSVQFSNLEACAAEKKSNNPKAKIDNPKAKVGPCNMPHSPS